MVGKARLTPRGFDLTVGEAVDKQMDTGPRMIAANPLESFSRSALFLRVRYFVDMPLEDAIHIVREASAVLLGEFLKCGFKLQANS